MLSALLLYIASISQPEKAQRAEGGDAQEDTTLDRATAMEDCSRLALEADQSLPIARAVREALTVLSATVSTSSSSASPHVVATVSSEVASAVVEAEELVDELLSVIQVSCYECFHDFRIQNHRLITFSSLPFQSLFTHGLCSPLVHIHHPSDEDDRDYSLITRPPMRLC